MSAQSTKKRQRTKKTSSTSSSSLQKEKKEKKLATGPKEITCDLEDGRLKANNDIIGMLCTIGPEYLACYIDSVNHNLTNAEKIQAWQFVIQYYENQIEQMKETCNKLQE